MKEIPEWLWAPLAAAVPSLIVGAVGLWTGLLGLFPSLGPTIFMQVHTPEDPSARPYHVVVGHATGAAAAVLSVWLVGAVGTPSALATDAMSGARVGASALAMGLTLALHVPLRVAHPPAAATALLVSLGAFAVTPGDLGTFGAGVLLVAALGEGLRRLRKRPGRP